MLGGIFYWLRHPVAEVPEELSYCEFECGELECHVLDVCQCPHRLQAGCVEQRDRGDN
ncbi:MAG: hypothetical protein R3F42_06985 [Pseudomonadota bacterium]